MSTVTIRISAEAKRKLSAHAKARRQTLSQALEDALHRLHVEDRWSRAARDQRQVGESSRKLMDEVNHAALKTLRGIR